MQSLHIGRLWPSRHAGGADRILADLAKYLPSYGIGVEALVAGGAADALQPVGAVVSSFADASAGTRARWIGVRKAVTARLDAGGVDVVVSHFSLYASAALDRLRRVPHVVHFQGPWAAESRQEGGGAIAARMKWVLEKMVYRSADRVIVLSEAFAGLARRDYGVPSGKLRVVPGAADLERFDVTEDRDGARRILGWPRDRRIIVSVRRLVHRTGVDRLIAAMPAVLSAVPDTHLFIGGTGPLLQPFKERVKELALGAHVTFLGYVPDEHLPLVYRAADLNVLPTVALEGFGLTAVESLAAGTPSMVTPVDALPEVVSGLSPALVFRSVDPSDIADGLMRALSGATALPSEAACRAYAVERFSADLMASRVAAIYQDVCS